MQEFLKKKIGLTFVNCWNHADKGDFTLNVFRFNYVTDKTHSYISVCILNFAFCLILKK